MPHGEAAIAVHLKRRSPRRAYLQLYASMPAFDVVFLQHSLREPHAD
jgi:hypothetical protein